MCQPSLWLAKGRETAWKFSWERMEVIKKMYVGNLPFDATEGGVRSAFEQFGVVHSVKLITDRETGRARGFGFVEMDDREADAAIAGLNGKEFGGRTLRVNEAEERGGRDRRSW